MPDWFVSAIDGVSEPSNELTWGRPNWFQVSFVYDLLHHATATKACVARCMTWNHLSPRGLWMWVGVGSGAQSVSRRRGSHGHVLHVQVPSARRRVGSNAQLAVDSERRQRGQSHHLHAVAQRGWDAGSRLDRHQARSGRLHGGRKRQHAPAC